MTRQMRVKESWGGRIGVILAVMGSAIGLGNFLRFPGLAAKYDGGMFMIPYLVALLLLGLPIAWMEWSMGRYGGSKGFNSSPGIFRAIWPNRSSPYFGVLGLIVPVGIYMYYVFIESWCLYYAYQYLVGGFPAGMSGDDYNTFFAGYTGAAEHGSLFVGGMAPAVYLMLLCFALNFVIIYRGLSRGIEMISRIAIPTLFLCALIILVRVLTLGTPDPSQPERNLLNGLGFMWNPPADLATAVTALGNAQMWLEAAGQIFFSLSVGFGIIITYASYLKRNDDVLLSGTSSAAGNIFAEVALGGMIIIPAAFIFLGAGGAGGGTFTLGFITLPMVFENMAFGRFFGFLFFFLLFIAAVTSSISMLQPAIAFFEEGLGLGRRASVAILGFITLIGSLFILVFSGGYQALDTMDFWIGSFFIFTLATIEVVIFAWVFGADKVMEEAHRGSLISLPRVVTFVMKYVSPVYLLTIFFFWAVQSMPGYLLALREDDVARYTLFFIILMGLFFLLLIATAVRRWQRLEAEK